MLVFTIMKQIDGIIHFHLLQIHQLITNFVFTILLLIPFILVLNIKQVICLYAYSIIILSIGVEA